jgi:hypothetical protein
VVLARVVPVGGGGGVVWTPAPTPTRSFKGVGGAARETERFPGLFMCGVPIGQRGCLCAVYPSVNVWVHR